MKSTLVYSLYKISGRTTRSILARQLPVKCKSFSIKSIDQPRFTTRVGIYGCFDSVYECGKSSLFVLVEGVETWYSVGTSQPEVMVL